MLMPALTGLLAIWFLIGIGSSLVQTPGGRLLRRSADEEDRPALFAAQFALSHACWLVTYLVAGVVGNEIGLSRTFRPAWSARGRFLRPGGVVMADRRSRSARTRTRISAPSAPARP
jgi:hypothetical protein